MSREFDVVVFGATGNAGKAMVEILAQCSGQLKRWAIAGRSPSKLEDLKQQLGANCDIIVADCQEQSSLVEMARRTRIVLTAAGPYSLYGEAVVRACIAARSHYADITGEASWVASMRNSFGLEAENAGVCLLSFCGYDCVPPELSLCLANEHFGQDFKLTSAECLFSADGMGMPRGTLLSVFEMAQSGPLKTMGELRTAIQALPPSEQWPCMRSLIFWMLPTWSSAAGHFTLPNMMGPVNIPVVHSAAHSTGFEGIRYYDRQPLPKIAANPFTLWGLLIILPLYLIVAPLAGLFMLLLPLLKRVFDIQKRLEARSFNGKKDAIMRVDTTGVGTAKDGRTRNVSVNLMAPGDPGIYATAFFACHTTLEMLKQLDNDSLPIGFSTPVVALGATQLAERLRKHGANIVVK